MKLEYENSLLIFQILILNLFVGKIFTMKHNEVWGAGFSLALHEYVMFYVSTKGIGIEVDRR